jgi:hypothetical protein
MSWDMESTCAVWVLENHCSSQNYAQVHQQQSQQELHGLYSDGASLAQHILSACEEVDLQVEW